MDWRGLAHRYFQGYIVGMNQECGDFGFDSYGASASRVLHWGQAFVSAYSKPYSWTSALCCCRCQMILLMIADEWLMMVKKLMMEKCRTTKL